MIHIEVADPVGAPFISDKTGLSSLLMVSAEHVDGRQVNSASVDGGGSCRWYCVCSETT